MLSSVFLNVLSKVKVRFLFQFALHGKLYLMPVSNMLTFLF